MEHTVAALEGGTGAVAFSSGMAAVAALMELWEPGDHIIASDDLYGGTYRLFAQISEKNGIRFSYVNTLEEIKGAITPKTKAVFIETPTNPMMRVTDIAAAAEITRPRRLPLIVDNTFLTPYFQRPLLMGADIVLHSGTKYLGGHNDTLAGVLVVKNDLFNERLRSIAKTTGACLSPFDAFLITRGIKTLAVRMERIQETAKTVAEWLRGKGGVEKVYYCGAGGMISFSVSDEPTAKKILESVKIIQYAESLGGVESLITYPMLQTHADMPEAERLARGIDARFLRLSVGLEAADDLTADLEQAF
jgi:cystathionine beta-lyase/cystathionine gamma-synthase